MLTRSALTIRLHPNDDVVIARSQLVGGTTLLDEKITVVGLVPPAHKIATRAIKKGEPVRRYNQIIGFASKDIAPGEHVHLNNLVMGSFDRDYAFGADMKPTQYVTPAATFMGIVRAEGPNEGRVATRNYIGILSTVNCSATVSRGIAEYFTKERLAEFPNVDGVVALTHGSGCGMDTHGEGMQLLRRTLGGYARHANFAGVLMIGLGCEANQISSLMGAENLKEGPLLRQFSIQDTGGTAKTIAHGIGLIKEMLPHANDVKRQPVPASHITCRPAVRRV
jgi:altronate hydrolase